MCISSARGTFIAEYCVDMATLNWGLLVNKFIDLVPTR